MSAKKNTEFTEIEIARIQQYLRQLFGNTTIAVDLPSRPRGPVEVRVGEEFVGVLHKDFDEGEISFDLHISILEEDLPAVGPGAKTK